MLCHLKTHSNVYNGFIINYVEHNRDIANIEFPDKISSHTLIRFCYVDKIDP